jgi:malonate decarboxylase epsilon subunit
MICLLFPGQGAQTPGFLKGLPATCATADVLAEASAVLGQDVSALDDASALQSTVAVQITALVAGVAMARSLTEAAVEIDAVAGLSVGSFAAGVAAGAIAFDDALKLVKLRATLMEAAYPTGYGMAAIDGLTAPRLQRLCDTLGSTRAPLYLANLNGATEIVATGGDAALDALMAAAQELGARRTQRLPVSVPSHCPLLSPVADRLVAALQEIEVKRPAITYIGNRRARALYDVAAVREELGTNVSHPVLWSDSTRLLYELGARTFIEAPPGAALTGLITSAFTDVRARAAAQTPLDGLVRLAEAAREDRDG